MKTIQSSLFKRALPFLVLSFLFLVQIFLSYSFVQIHPNISLDSSLVEYAEALGPSDSASYLRVAINFANGLGVVGYCEACNPPGYSPFIFWGPGAPIFFGYWIKWTEGTSVLALFVLFWVTYFVAGCVLLASACRLINRQKARIITAISIAICPPFLFFQTGAGLASSEVACIIPLSVMIFFLITAFSYLRDSNGKLLTISLNFAFLGISIGLLALIRESYLPFSKFIFVFLMLGAWLKWYPWKKSLAAGIFLLIFSNLAVLPVKYWNQVRYGAPVISTSSSAGIWRYGLWSNHNAHVWYINTGIGVGQYLDPKAAEDVEKYYQEGNTSPIFSIKKFALVVLQNPIEFLIFKLDRIPSLFLGTERLSAVLSGNGTFTVYSRLYMVWGMVFYSLFIAYIIYCRLNKILIHEFLYLFLLFISCAAVLIHFEYRYTHAVWMSLMLLPGLFYEKTLRNHPS